MYTKVYVTVKKAYQVNVLQLRKAIQKKQIHLPGKKKPALTLVLYTDNCACREREEKTVPDVLGVLKN